MEIFCFFFQIWAKNKYTWYLTYSLFHVIFFMIFFCQSPLFGLMRLMNSSQPEDELHFFIPVVGILRRVWCWQFFNYIFNWNITIKFNQFSYVMLTKPHSLRMTLFRLNFVSHDVVWYIPRKTVYGCISVLLYEKLDFNTKNTHAMMYFF